MTNYEAYATSLTLKSWIISFGRSQPVGNFHADNGTNNNFCGPLVQRIRSTSTRASTRTRFLLLLERLLFIGLHNGARWLLLIAHSMWISYLWGSLSGWTLKRNETTVVYTEWEDVFIIQFSNNYDLLYEHECFTYWKINHSLKLHSGPKWRIFHILACEDIDDVIYHFFTVGCCNSQFVYIKKNCTVVRRYDFYSLMLKTIRGNV